jgi:hypothetical protein
MLKKIIQFKDNTERHYRQLFNTQDSKFFLSTAVKLTLIPVISFAMVFYSLWMVMEMNFNFFVANGFASSDLFKEAFYDRILLDTYQYLPLFAGIILGVFLTGLFISWLVLRTFKVIEKHSIASMNGDESEFEAPGLLKAKVISQVARLFFKYLEIYKIEQKRPRIKIPNKLEKMISPPIDRVFFIQYGLIISIVCMITNLTIYTFTNELYQQIVAGGIDLLEGNRIVVKFLSSEKNILFNIYAFSIGANILLYALISKNIIKSIDGVSFGFSRDMLKVIQGEHETRLRPRYSDPGNKLANFVNDYLDMVFIEEQTEDSHQVPTFQAVENDGLPPAFVEQKITPSGEQIFHITTPDGDKLENIDKDLLLQLVKKS